MQCIVEHVCEAIVRTDPRYLDDMKRRLSALVVLWWETIEEPYDEPRLRHFAAKTREWLDQHCQAAGFRTPNNDDLSRRTAATVASVCGRYEPRGLGATTAAGSSGKTRSRAIGGRKGGGMNRNISLKAGRRKGVPLSLGSTG
jgi:hypothetical protein